MSRMGGPADLLSQLRQLVLEVDDLVERAPGTDANLSACFFGRIVPSDARKNHASPPKGILKSKLQGSEAPNP